MDKDLVLPQKVDDLIKLLNELYPEKSPEVKDGTVLIGKSARIPGSRAKMVVAR